MILIDTSAWIEFFRNKEPFATRVSELIEDNLAAVAGPILTELLRGTIRHSQQNHLFDYLRGIHTLSDPDLLWEEAGLIGFRAAQKGYSIKTLDLLISVFALSEDIPILTRDTDFKYLQKAGIPLRLA